MKVTCKLYATLMSYLPAETKGHAVPLDVDDTTTVQQLIDRFRIPEELAFLVMLNGVYIQPNDRSKTRFREQDTLAIWPKVAGG